MKRILVIDDEVRIRHQYSDLLYSEGYQVLEAADADSANEVLKTHKVDLVLLDIRMPMASGAVFHEVMQLFHRKVKVIVASVYHVDQQKRFIHKATDYFDKSHGVHELLTKIKKALGEDGALSETSAAAPEMTMSHVSRD